MKQPYVAVVGGINIDVCGKAFGPLIPRDSNPGQLRLSPGGVGRNAAHNLALLGVPVFLLTALAGDRWEGLIRGSCKAAGIDLSRARYVPEGITSGYLAIEGPEGDMELALCDNRLAEEITPAYLEEQLELLNGAAAVVLDANLTEQAIAFLAERVRAPLFADPVSVRKGEKLRPVLGRLFSLKPNRVEAEALSGVRITDRNSLELAAAKLLQTGLRRLCVSLGSRGVYCAWDTERCLAPCPETRLVNASGGGDAMTAGFVRAYLDGLPIEAAARFALACGSLAVESPETVNPALCYAAARERAVGAVIGRPPQPPEAQAVGAVIGRPPQPPEAQTVGAVIGRPPQPSEAQAVGAVIGRPRRKRNRLEAYDYTQGGAYHIVLCTEGRKCVFSQVYEGADTQQLRLYPLGQMVEQAILAIPVHYPTVEIVRYCVMPNHVHLLLRLSTEQENPSVSWIINQLKGAVTKKAGTKIWQKGFYDQVIRSEADFQAAGEYIEYNPAKWKTDDYYVSPH